MGQQNIPSRPFPNTAAIAAWPNNAVGFDMNTASAAILENAKRLLDDAQALAVRGSFKTAMSLAVLSLEESGKACLVRWAKAGYITDDIADEVRAVHIGKQRVLAAYKGLLAILSVATIKRKEEITPEEWDREDIALNELVRRTLAASLVVPKGQAEVGLLDHMKQCGFYVDVDERLDVVSPTIPATREWYDILHDEAAHGIRMAEAEDRDQMIMAIMYKSLGKPLVSGKARKEALGNLLASIRTSLQRTA